MKKIFVFLIIVASYITASGQSPKRAIKKLGSDPVMFIDSVNISYSELSKYNPTDIAVVTVFKGKEAIELLGDYGKDGAVYIFTKKYAKNSYWNYFKSKSKEYSGKILSPEGDSVVQYILNKRILTTNFEGVLMNVDDTVFKEIIFIDKETLEKEYNVFDKAFGILIKSDIPDNLYKGRKKFK